MSDPTFFEDLKSYVGFTEASSRTLRELHPLARPSFPAIVDDFYATIDAHPAASVAITGGRAQVERLKTTLLAWLEKLLLGPHDQAYYELRARIGRVHVRIGLPQHYMLTAMNRVRTRLVDVIRVALPAPTRAAEATTALNQILDIELAIMLETYRESLEAKTRDAERLAAIGQLAAGIGHELRNPLAVVESSLFLLRHHLPAGSAPPQVFKHLDRIGWEVKRAGQTIEDILELTRNRPPLRAPTDLRRLVEHAAENALLPAAVDLDLAVPPGQVAHLDGDQIRQVLINLFANSAQAMAGHGTIHVDASTARTGDTVLRVRDDGPGVPPADRGRIFDALYTTKARGTGLGLALCRRIMEAHGGSIGLEDATPGATFLLRFPPAPEPQRAVDA